MVRFAKRLWIYSLCTICLGVIVPTLSGQESRREFVAKLSTINNRMTMGQVEQILGKPDDVWTESDERIHDPYVEVVWCYGNATYLQLPTLGRVGFDKNGRVYQIIGKGAHPIAAKNIGETRLRQLLQSIDSGPGLLGRNFNPYELVTLANTFQPLGQERAFAVFREYERVTNRNTRGEETIHLLLLCLHKPPGRPGYFPQVDLGAALPPPPVDLRLFPRFPLHFIDDVPFLLVAAYEVGGEPATVTAQLEVYEHEFAWIDEPLHINRKPIKELSNALSAFRQSPQWYFNQNRPGWIWKALYAPSPWIMDMLESQLQRFVDDRDKQAAESATSAANRAGS